MARPPQAITTIDAAIAAARLCAGGATQYIPAKNAPLINSAARVLTGSTIEPAQILLRHSTNRMATKVHCTAPAAIKAAGAANANRSRAILEYFTGAPPFRM